MNLDTQHSVNVMLRQLSFIRSSLIPFSSYSPRTSLKPPTCIRPQTKATMSTTTPIQNESTQRPVQVTQLSPVFVESLLLNSSLLIVYIIKRLKKTNFFISRALEFTGFDFFFFFEFVFAIATLEAAVLSFFVLIFWSLFLCPIWISTLFMRARSHDPAFYSLTLKPISSINQNLSSFKPL